MCNTCYITYIQVMSVNAMSRPSGAIPQDLCSQRVVVDATCYQRSAPVGVKGQCTATGNSPKLYIYKGSRQPLPNCGSRFLALARLLFLVTLTSAPSSLPSTVMSVSTASTAFFFLFFLFAPVHHNSVNSSITVFSVNSNKSSIACFQCRQEQYCAL